MTASTEDLKKAVEQAEAAVASLKDAELRKAAFEKVLERLLASGHSRAPVAHPPARSRAAPPKANSVQKGTQKAKDGPTARVEELIEQGHFDAPRTLGDILTELGNTAGLHMDRKQLAVVMLRLIRRKQLRRKPGAGSEKYVYSNW